MLVRLLQLPSCDDFTRCAHNIFGWITESSENYGAQLAPLSVKSDGLYSRPSFKLIFEPGCVGQRP